MPTIYSWAQLTSQAMTNLYLYGQITTPQQDLLSEKFGEIGVRP